MGLYSEKGLAFGKTFLFPIFKFKMQNIGYKRFLNVHLNKINVASR
ncbi:hypothetical protein A33Q_3980 [Indibacter alkaliphilus LW1]|uniref:Uncharacterized protein n=1 Tax=Indibacter alkaliphilus (strain CCUG 57479 / KCTC 22604 / LW1) TaxID=1189612 RepID=S2D161_INDAL|nr:hypothetical protein A33Q_3980 [Indibacter alkaliphilus LW1]